MTRGEGKLIVASSRRRRTAVVGVRGALVGGVLLSGALAAVAGPVGAVLPPFECVRRPSTASEGTPNAGLLGALGVLRRSPTAADVLPAKYALLPGLGEGVYVKYVRFAQTVAGTSYYLIPVTKGCSSLGEEVVLETKGPGEFGSISGNTLTQIEHGKRLGTVGKASSTASGVVPDKVARVVLIYARSPYRHRVIKVSAKVVNNVFVAAVPLGPGLADQPSKIVWRTAHGAAIHTFTWKP